jgi:PIN domain nuclease of toxin-antitoxin system
MKYILDTHVLLWTAGLFKALPLKLRHLIEDSENELFFSAASMWEISIKNGLGKAHFCVDIHRLRRGLLDHGYLELSITSQHVIGVSQLPLLHKDPFDRILIAQAIQEGMLLLTTDNLIAKYNAPIELIKTRH